ncbi:hypothetical protein LCGC14_2719510, partial [marine sediment metagenome]
SYTGTEILLDEADFHERFGASYEALLPLIHDTGGRLFAVSTPNFDLVDSPFRQVFQKSSHQLYLGYYDRPGRTDETYQYAEAQSQDKARFEKENSRTAEEALAPPRTRAFFEPGSLTAMMAETMPAREVLGPLSIWREPVVAGKYILAADTAWGVTGSYNCGAIFDAKTWDQVAELHGRLHPNEMAYELWQLHKKYNHAYMVLERAGEGQERDGESVVVVDKVEELMEACECHTQGYISTRMFYYDWKSLDPQRPGWQTDSKTRPDMLGEFREAVRGRELIIRSREGVTEMMTFVRNDKGRPEASKGAYDDRVMTYAEAWAVRDIANFGMGSAPKQTVTGTW